MKGPGALIPPFQLLLLIQVPRGLLSLSWTQLLNLIIPPSKAPLFSLLYKVIELWRPPPPRHFLHHSALSLCWCTSCPYWRSLRTFHGGCLRQPVANKDTPLDLSPPNLPPLESLALHLTVGSSPQMVAFTHLGHLAGSETYLAMRRTSLDLPGAIWRGSPSPPPAFLGFGQALWTWELCLYARARV